jgi:hypothetical protein
MGKKNSKKETEMPYNIQMIDRIIGIIEAHEIDASSEYSPEKNWLQSLRKNFIN